MGQRHAVGLVGCGHWGRHVLRDLLALGCRVHVCDPDPAARAHAREAGAGTAEAVEALPDLDGYVVATPATTHAGVAEALLPRGAPLFVEKPLTADPASARRLAEVAPERLFVMDKWRYHAGVAQLAALVRDGTLGRALGLETTRTQWGHTQREDVDGLWTLAPHDLAIALEVLGEIPVPRAAVAERVGGAPTHLVALLGGAPWMSLRVSVRAPERCRRVRLRTEGGVATLDDPGSAVVLEREGSRPERLPFEGELPLLAELRAFVAYLAGGPPPRSSAAEGARNVEVVAALRELAGLPPAGGADRL